MIHLKNIHKSYSKKSVGVKDINLSIEAGEFVSIVGQSGTGKTTLVKLLIAEERPTKGVIEIGGWDISRIPNKHVPFLRRQIGVIFQDFKLLEKKTVHENVSFALQVAGESSRRIRDIVPRVLDIVGLTDKAHAYPHQLSGGQQQRVVIARSLVHRPKILVADEPTGNLDTLNSQEIMEILKKINEFGTTIILVTHDRDIVNQLGRRVVTIHNGTIVSDEKVGTYRLQ
jgi:cell division transport system ATP-binding protein